MKLLIKQCSDTQMWYRNHIGKEVPYLGKEDNIYWSREDAGWKNIVLQKDAEIIKDKTTDNDQREY